MGNLLRQFIRKPDIFKCGHRMLKPYGHQILQSSFTEF